MKKNTKGLVHYQELRKAVLELFLKDRPYGADYSLEEMQIMKSYLELVE